MKSLGSIGLDRKEYYRGKNEVPIQEECLKKIAIIGIGLKFPNADNMNEFLEIISEKKDCIKEMSDCRKRDFEAVFSKEKCQYEKGSFLDEVDKFDYNYFNISPAEAEVMDPNQRILLQTAYKAIQDAGYESNRIYGTKTGIFIGFGADADYKQIIDEKFPELSLQAMVGNIKPIIPSRIAYYLNLHGPSMLVDTACSSSLIAVHLACKSIMNKECEMALAGGIQLHLKPKRISNIGIESSDNRTKTFDDSSDGTGTGEGCGILLLKPLEAAQRDHDNIYAVIAGSAINNDGASNGITAPSAQAQTDVICSAWKDAKVEPEQIEYIEAHGTGTKLGDPIEVTAIKNAFSRYTSRKQFCAIGSVKSNMGHLDSAAGIAGIIKTVLCLKYKIIPPTLHFKRPNRNIQFEDSPVYVSDEKREWSISKGKRIAGVSSFGMSGTNGHIVLEEYVHNEEERKKNSANMFALTAKDSDRLAEYVQVMFKFLRENPKVCLEDLCYTMNTGRQQHSHRVVFVFDSYEQLINQLNSYVQGKITSNVYTCSFNVVKTGSKGHKKNEIVLLEQKEYTEKANVIIKQCITEEDKRKELAYLFCKGADVFWEKIYDDDNYKISCPTYPFAKKRCWIGNSDEKKEYQDYLFSCEWVSHELNRKLSYVYNETFLVFNNKDKKMNQAFSISNAKATFLQFQEKEIVKSEESSYSVWDDFLYDDLRKILQKQREVTSVVFCIENEEDINEKQQNIELEQNIERLRVIFLLISEIYKDRQIKFYLIGNNAVNIPGYTMDLPLVSVLYGICLGVNTEIDKIQVTCIDMDKDTEYSCIMDEMSENQREAIVAYRKGNRYTRQLGKLPQQEECRDYRIEDGDVYVFAGGYGHIGKKFIRYFIEQKKVHIVVLGRRSKEDVSEIAWKYPNAVEYYQTDITNQEITEQTILNIKDKYGKIDGVINFAGVGVGMKGKTFLEEDKKVFHEVMKPKVVGTMILEQLTRTEKLKFFVLSSSAITVTGGIGSSHYIAANYFMDNYAAYIRNKGIAMISMNWGPWMEEELLDMDRQIFFPIQEDVGISLFLKTVNRNVPGVVLGKVNLNSPLLVMEGYLPFRLSEELQASKEPEKAEKQRELETTKKEISFKYSDVERAVMDVWKEILKFDNIDIYDSFFDIGGDSIIITKVYEKLKQLYPGKLEISDLFAYPSIAELAQYIAEEQTDIKEDTYEEAIDDEINELLNNLGNGDIDIQDAMKYFER